MHFCTHEEGASGRVLNKVLATCRQNSTLGAVLAAVHFKDPTTAVPCAISACMHSLLGSALAAYFRSRTPPNGLNERPLESQSLA